ncbi:hypothetical protein G6F37_007743 [Rhizopus arrhizus]|nr:hypothetical protein G6F37_007743 [Rhizopus arrhizus]
MSDIEFTENNERTYTQNEMEEIIRNVVRQMDVEKEEKANGNEIPLDISNELANTPSYQLQENFKKFRRETQRYTLDEWTTLEKINKTILPYLKRHSTETAMSDVGLTEINHKIINKDIINDQTRQMVVNTIYKITENTRFQARVAMEIFEQLQYVLQEATSQAEATAIIDKCREQSRRLAVFGLATAKTQEREARDYSDKACY